MKLFINLIIIYIIIIVIVIIIIKLLRNHGYGKNYLQRAFVDLEKCPFGKLEFRTIEILRMKAPILAKSSSKGIISYSLFGNYEKYSKNLFKNNELIMKYLPGWHARIYVSIDVPNDIIERLTDHAEVYIMGPRRPLGLEASTWRFFPASEKLPFVSLDSDDIFDRKMANEIKKWINSGKTFANFCPYKWMVPMSAGYWGARPRIKKDGTLKPAIPNIQEKIFKYCEHWYGFDETFLRIEIYPLFKKYGFYQGSHYYFQEITIIILSLFVILVIASLVMAYRSK